MALVDSHVGWMQSMTSSNTGQSRNSQTFSTDFQCPVFWVIVRVGVRGSYKSFCIIGKTIRSEDHWLQQETKINSLVGSRLAENRWLTMATHADKRKDLY